MAGQVLGLGQRDDVVGDLGERLARVVDDVLERMNARTDSPEEWQAQPPVGSTWLEPAQ